MEIESSVLNRAERIGMKLRNCYHSFGYTQYKMRKFEEYDLYAKNKDFLVSNNVITFNDCDGRLMALKPDVTLSIARGGRDEPGSVQKVYYHENVYRVPKNSGNFREIQQAGLECIGDVDTYLISEVLMLACRSLRLIKESSVLCLSHLGLLSGLIEPLGLNGDTRQELLQCIGARNIHGLRELCLGAGADDDRVRRLCDAVELYGDPREVIPRLKALGCDGGAVSALELFTEQLMGNGFGSQVCIDFSTVSDLSYYNGIVFQGYVEGVPVSVLSGGQYDRLMERMGRSSRAIGFAVYLDALERPEKDEAMFDIDLLLRYDEETDIGVLNSAVKKLTDSGLSVLAAKKEPEMLRCRRRGIVKGSEVVILEEHA